MFIIPTGTDAPIYHWPIVTVAMILLNIGLFFVVPPDSGNASLDEIMAADVTTFESYALTIGDGLHPVQWVTHNFLHYSLSHLAGNLVFLWSFGIVVEGKLGAFKFLSFYLAVGTLHGAFVQFVLLKSGLSGHAAGASAVVYGLLATCMIWAPRNELTCTIIIIAFYRIFVFQREFYYTTVALLYVGMQLVGLIFWGVAGEFMVSELGHLSGATWGAILAVLMLKLQLVDCEDWDIFTLWAKRTKLAQDWEARGQRLNREQESITESVRAQAKSRRKTARTGASEEPSPEERAAAAVKKVLGLIEQGNVEAGLLAYDKSSRALPYWPSQRDLYAIIKTLHAQGALIDSIRPMRDHCRRFPAASDKMRLMLAQVLIKERQRPLAALQVLEEIPPDSLSPDLERTRQNLTRQAEKMQEEGVLEVEGDD